MEQIKQRLPMCSQDLVQQIKNSTTFLNKFLDCIYEVLFSHEQIGSPELLSSVIFGSHSSNPSLNMMDPDQYELCRTIFSQNVGDRARILDLCDILLRGNEDVKKLFFNIGDVICSANEDKKLTHFEIPEDGFLHLDLIQYNKMVDTFLTEKPHTVALEDMDTQPFPSTVEDRKCYCGAMEDDEGRNREVSFSEDSSETYV